MNIAELCVALAPCRRDRAPDLGLEGRALPESVSVVKLSNDPPPWAYRRAWPAALGAGGINAGIETLSSGAPWC
jgi:hypothetical protein